MTFWKNSDKYRTMSRLWIINWIQSWVEVWWNETDRLIAAPVVRTTSATYGKNAIYSLCWKDYRVRNERNTQTKKRHDLGTNSNNKRSTGVMIKCASRWRSGGGSLGTAPGRPFTLPPPKNRRRPLFSIRTLSSRLFGRWSLAKVIFLPSMDGAGRQNMSQNVRHATTQSKTKRGRKKQSCI